MSSKLPANLTVRRKVNDTYAEVFRIVPGFPGATATLGVNGIGTRVDGDVDATGEYLSFPITQTAISQAPPAHYDFDVIITFTNGQTRTLVEGKWLVEARKVS
jgi:hypothetical protein